MFVVQVKESSLCSKATPRAWNRRVDSFLLDLGFTKFAVEHDIYVRHHNERSELFLICLNVDDLLVTGRNKKAIE